MEQLYRSMPDRLRAYGITQHTLRQLRVHRDFVLSVLPDVVDLFIRHVTARPQLAAFFTSQPVVAHVREKQMAHWSLLVHAEFGQDYVSSVQAMGRTHNRIGLSPKLYIEGYNLMLKTVCSALAARRNAGGRTPSISAILGIQQALTACMMMDMDYVIEVYEEADNTILF